jgi:GNAT superfamily N-acetyltransferase
VRRAYAQFDGPALDAWIDRFASQRYFQERMDSEDCEFFVLGEPGAPYAMGALKVRDGKAYVGDLYCAAPGNGHGRQLMKQALERADRMGLGEAVCDVFSSNEEALRFVRRAGFAPVGGYLEQSLGVWVHRLSRPVSPDPISVAAQQEPSKILRDDSLDRDQQRAAVKARFTLGRAWQRAHRRAQLQQLHGEQDPQLLDAIAAHSLHQVRTVDFDAEGAILKGVHPGGEEEPYWLRVRSDGTSERLTAPDDAWY